MQTARAVSPSGTARKKLVLLSIVVVRAPSAKLSTLAAPPRMSAKAMMAPPCMTPLRLASSSPTVNSASIRSREPLVKRTPINREKAGFSSMITRCQRASVSRSMAEIRCSSAVEADLPTRCASRRPYRELIWKFPVGNTLAPAHPDLLNGGAQEFHSDHAPGAVAPSSRHLPDPQLGNEVLCRPSRDAELGSDHAG